MKGLQQGGSIQLATAHRDIVHGGVSSQRFGTFVGSQHGDAKFGKPLSQKFQNAILGMPSAATPEIGEKLYQGALDALEKAVRALQSQS